MSSDDCKPLDLCKYLWEEYKYRHDLIWQRIFTFTTTIVLISIVPYVQVALVDKLAYLIIIAPVIAFILALFGCLVIWNELKLFGKIKKRYRIWQNQLDKPPLHDNPNEEGLFSSFVIGYFVVLTTLSLINVIVLFCLIPKLGESTSVAKDCLTIIN